VARVLLADIAFARSGDKGDIADLGLFAPAGPHAADVYEVMRAQVTAERVKAHFGTMVRGEVTRYEVPNILALKFVMTGALRGGGPCSLRADNLGKALGGALLRLPVDVDDELRARLGERPRPPRDPYRGAPWVAEPRIDSPGSPRWPG
jgi:hypothetical protein